MTTESLNRDIKLLNFQGFNKYDLNDAYNTWKRIFENENSEFRQNYTEHRIFSKKIKNFKKI